jgi:hypothetical protein
MEQHLDIFTKIMAYLFEHKGQMSNILNSIIQFQQVDVRADMANWKMRVMFDMSRMSREEKDILLFDFEALGTAGYNGHPIFNRQQTKGQDLLAKPIIAPYAGGVQNQELLANLFFRDYATYGFGGDRFIRTRMAGTTHPDLKRFLQERKFISHTNIYKKMHQMKISDADIETYLADATIAMIDTLYQNKRSYYTVDLKQKLKNYRKAQHFYFLSDAQLKEQVKKRIFFTLYGLLTKSGYRIFTDTDVEAFVKKTYPTMMTKGITREVTAEFQLVPHLMLGSLAY